MLFTDICGSTAFTERLGDRASTDLVREHDRIVRGRIEAHAGREIKHTGDGIMACFDTPSVAVRELCIGKLIRFEAREPLNLGGFSEAVRCFV